MSFHLFCLLRPWLAIHQSQIVEYVPQIGGDIVGDGDNFIVGPLFVCVWDGFVEGVADGLLHILFRIEDYVDGFVCHICISLLHQCASGFRMRSGVGVSFHAVVVCSA